MASVVASGKASSKAATGNPNPTSAQYAAQRGSVDMLMRIKDKDARPPTSTASNITRGDASAAAASAPKMSFLEAVRAQRQVRVQQLRNAPKPNGPTGSALAVASAASADPSSFHKGSSGGGFSALATGSSSSKASKRAKAKPQAQSNTAWVAALATPPTGTGSNMATAPAATTSTMATTSAAGQSYTQVENELEADFQKYSRANPLGGVGTSRGGGGGSNSEGDKQKKGQPQNQGQGQGQQTNVPMTASARNLKARQLMVAPQSASRREDDRIAAMNLKKKQQYKNGGDDSSDEDVGRSALGRKKARKG